MPQAGVLGRRESNPEMGPPGAVVEPFEVSSAVRAHEVICDGAELRNPEISSEIFFRTP